MNSVEPYLAPYVQATQKHNGGFRSLLWASHVSQRARFHAIVRLGEFRNRRILDGGCGHADFLDYLIQYEIRYEHYTGIEAVEELAEVARGKNRPRSAIIRADFLREPQRMLVGADVVVLCGSLNTFDVEAFHRTIRLAYDAAGESLIFNFLSSGRLAAAAWLHWHRPEDVLAFARNFTDDVASLSDYMDGDCTIAMRKGGSP